jgi:hypothetical protein
MEDCATCEECKYDCEGKTTEYIYSKIYTTQEANKLFGELIKFYKKVGD